MNYFLHARYRLGREEARKYGAHAMVDPGGVTEPVHGLIDSVFRAPGCF